MVVFGYAIGLMVANFAVSYFEVAQSTAVDFISCELSVARKVIDFSRNVIFLADWSARPLVHRASDSWSCAAEVSLRCST